MAAAGDRYEKSSQEYITSVITMAQALEYAGMQTQSESMMRDLSRDLVGMGSGGSKVMLPCSWILNLHASAAARSGLLTHNTS